MELKYDIWLLLLSLVASSTAVFLAFGFISHLYRSSTTNRLLLLPICSIAIGSGIWGVQLLNWLSFNTDSTFQFSIPILAISWLFSGLVGYSICYAASQKTIPFPLLISNSLIAGLCSYAMFYFTAAAMHTAKNIAFDPVSLLIAFLMAIVVCMLSVLTLSWMKEYAGDHILLVKVILSMIIAAAIFGLHVAFSASINLLTNPQVATEYAVSDKKLLAGIISLSIICLFLLVFIVAIFYEKSGKSTFKFSILNKQKNLNVHVLDAKDTLTSLPNRRSFQHQLEAATKRCTRTGDSIAVAFIDLDHFKPINDQFGHHIGDAVLISVAQRLQAAVRGCDLVARLGGDEFVALIEEIKSDEDIVPIVERIVHSVKEPFLVNHHHIEISCSVGIAIYPRDGDIEKLMICADTAMYKAKEAGKNQFKFYDTKIEYASEQLLVIHQDLLQAFEHNQLTLAFQPKFDCKTRLPVGAEALIRWKHPSKGELSPKDFIVEAERFGLISKINDWVLEEVCRTIQQASNKGIDLNISVNLASQQFRNGNLVHEVTEVLRQHEVPASKLTFEIKEHAAIKNEMQFKLLLSQFKLAKIKIALDDFGLNPFTLTYLQELNIDELKLDRAFIAKISENIASKALVDGVIRLAHALGYNVVAEGVETDAQCNMLANLGCNHMQGYLFSKPIAKDDLLNLFNSSRNKFESNS
jgi:diguanylate cyclase